MLLNELLKAIQPVQVTGDSRIEITGVNIDSPLPFRRERLPSSAKIYRRNP